MMKRFFTFLAIHTSGLTFQYFRAGGATHLAASGASAGQILAAGEWRTPAVVSYLNESEIGAQAVTVQLLEASDSEDVASGLSPSS